MRFGLIFFGVLGSLLLLYGVMKGVGITNVGTSGIAHKEASPTSVQ